MTKIQMFTMKNKKNQLKCQNLTRIVLSLKCLCIRKFPHDFNKTINVRKIGIN